MENTVDIPHEVVPAPVESSPEFIVLKFADSKVPAFKETRSKDWILYGEDNRYPEYLLHLFNKSAKHNAILTGKANYIFGEGFENGDQVINRLGESLNDIAKKCILDRCIYGGWRVEILWNNNRRIAEIYHVDYSSIRTGKDGGYYYKETWDPKNRDEPDHMAAFNPAMPVGSQIYAYDEYRPGVRFYPLPDYIGCNNYVETDIEISKYYLSSIRNGMMPSKMIQFFKGEPSEDKKREIEHRFGKKFSGAENAGKFLLVFNDVNASRSVEINDLSASELDKQFVELNKTCQQEIFSGHLVTSPALFGIKTEGQLGSTQELKVAYEIFVNTYAKPKAHSFDKEINYLLSYSMWPAKYELRPTDPIGWQIPEELLKQAITPDEVREKLGLDVVEKPIDSPATKTLNAISGVSPLVATKILDNLTQNEIRSLASLPPIANGDVVPGGDGALPPVAAPELDTDVPNPTVNKIITNLTPKQHQQVLRVMRQYGKGQLTELAARAFLRVGYGLTEQDINDLLGISTAPAAMSAAIQEDDIVAMFDACGETKADFEIIKSKKVSFSSELEAEHDEEIFIQEAFKTYDVTYTEQKIIDLIKKDSKITLEVIAEAIGQTKSYVQSKIDSLTQRGYLESTTEFIGEDEIVERIIPKDLDISTPPPTAKTPSVQISIKYSYEVKPNIGPAIIENTRPFCIKMIQLNRLYSRADIEKISDRLGYSVFDRKGGWWGDKPECRHRWVSNIVVKKK